MRRTVLPQLSLEPGGAQGKKEEVLRALRKTYGKEMQGRAWYPALAQELVAEETESDADARKARLLASLAIPEPLPVESGPPPEGKPILMEAVKILSRPHEELMTAVESLSETERLLQTREGGFGQALRRLFGRSQRPKADLHTYEITFSEPVKGTTKSEKVSFPQFAEETRKKATLLAAIAAGTGPAYKRIQTAPEASLAGFVDKQLNEMLLVHRRLASFNTLFQARANQAGRQGVRGIKLELLTIRNSIVKANQRRHEYGEMAEVTKEKQTRTPT
ncbi:MAG TPA: hypothetical protein VFB30_13815, partial [Spirochaetia bacterium]|nr:hypothetical protein [Spirochaetia bacterium]